MKSKISNHYIKKIDYQEEKQTKKNKSMKKKVFQNSKSILIKQRKIIK